MHNRLKLKPQNQAHVVAEGHHLLKLYNKHIMVTLVL